MRKLHVTHNVSIGFNDALLQQHPGIGIKLAGSLRILFDHRLKDFSDFLFLVEWQLHLPADDPTSFA